MDYYDNLKETREVETIRNHKWSTLRLQQLCQLLYLGDLPLYDDSGYIQRDDDYNAKVCNEHIHDTLANLE